MRIPALWLPIILKRLSFLVFFLSLILLILFLLGNNQDFLDSTQEMLLSIMEWSFSLLILCTFFYALFLLFFGIIRKKFLIIIYMAFPLVIAVISTALVVLVKFIILWIHFD